MANPKKHNNEKGTSGEGALNGKKAGMIAGAICTGYEIYNHFAALRNAKKYSENPTADDGIDIMVDSMPGTEEIKEQIFRPDRIKDTAKERKDHADSLSPENIPKTLDKLEEIGGRVNFGDGSSLSNSSEEGKSKQTEWLRKHRNDLVKDINQSLSKILNTKQPLSKSEWDKITYHLEIKAGEYKKYLNTYGNDFDSPTYSYNNIINYLAGDESKRPESSIKDPYHPCHYSPPMQGQDSCYMIDKHIEVLNRDKVFINTYDPIVLDLNGDGKISINKRTNSNVYFDYLGDGTSIKTSWVGKEDGILVFDKNNDGKINDGSELLGNFTQKPDGSTTKHGYEALSLLDSNKDGIIDAKDEGFVNLKVWQDANSNGVVDEGEMKKLSEFNISSLNLAHQTENKNLEDRNKITHVGSYTMTDGSSRTMADVEFSVLPNDSKVKVDEKYIKNHITGVNVGGTGRLADLAIAANISSDLSELLCMYAMLDSKEKQMGILDELLYEWAKTDSKFNSYNIELLKAQEVSQGEADSKTTIISLTPSQAKSFREQMANGCKDEALLARFESSKRKIQVVSAMVGMDLSKHYYSTDERLKKFLDTVDTIYDNLKSDTYRILLPQTRLKEYMERLYVVTDKDGNISYDSTWVIDKFKEINLSDPKKAFVDLAEFTTLFQNKKDFAAGLSLLAEFAYGANKRGVLSEYLDTLGKDMQSKINITTSSSGSAGDDIMVGSENNDSLYGGNGNDILEGGAGNDHLQGGKGDDTYIFNKGDGADTIHDHEGNDTIKFGEGISKEDLIVRRGSDSDDLVIGFKNSKGDSITLNDIYANGGSTRRNGIGTKNFKFADKTTLSLEDIEKLSYEGSEESDYLRGLDETNDIIKGFDGNDNIQSLGGNDTLYGGTGNDQLCGGAGDDTLHGDEGDDHLHGDNGDDILYGGEGNDVLEGKDGNDTLYGGAGNDYLNGGAGDDTYIFNKGDGADTISNSDSSQDRNDIIKFKEGISKENITFQRVANDLVLKYGENDTVRINNQFGGGAIEQIALASGEYITASKINKIIEDLNAYASNNGMSNISMEDMKNNPDIMQMFASGWGN